MTVFVGPRKALSQENFEVNVFQSKIIWRQN